MHKKQHALITRRYMVFAFFLFFLPSIIQLGHHDLVLLQGFNLTSLNSSLFAQDKTMKRIRPRDRMRPVEITFDQKYVGSYATIFYVSAKNSVLTTKSSRLIITDVLKRFPSYAILENEKLILDNSLLPIVNGVFLNYLLVFIHDDEKKQIINSKEYKGVFIKNPDGTCPEYHDKENPLTLEECLELPDESFISKDGYTYELKARERTKALKIKIGG